MTVHKNEKRLKKTRKTSAKSDIFLKREVLSIEAITTAEMKK